MQLVLIALFVFSSLFSFAQLAEVPLSEVEIFNRCYLKMVRKVIPRTQSIGKTLRDRVIANAQTANSGATACLDLFDQALFNSNGVALGLSGELDNQEVGSLIKNFHNFHISWFQGKELNNQAAVDMATLLMRDTDEPALYFTRSLFSQTVTNLIDSASNPHGLRHPLSSVLTTNVHLRSIRKNRDNLSRWDAKTINLRNQAFHQGGMLLSSGTVSRTTATLLPLNIDFSTWTDPSLLALRSTPINDSLLVPSGQIIGVESVSPLQVPFVLFLPNYTDTTLRNEIRTLLKPQLDNVNIYQHFGGGLLGSQMFILKNTNLTFNQLGGSGSNKRDDVIARRLSSRIYQDLMCHELPTLNDQDVTANPNSEFAFHRSVSCMKCHYSIDPLAYAYRNLGLYRTGDNVQASHTVEQRSMGSPITGVFKVPIKSDSNIFALKAPNGTLRFRNHNGTGPVSISVNSLQELGTAILDQPDFYRCIAKRYYYFLTGVDVRLRLPSGESQNPTEAEHRDNVFRFGTRLKNHQSLRQLIYDIVASPTFKSRNFKVLGEATSGQ